MSVHTSHHDWADSMAAWGHEHADELKAHQAHRALPLDVVEAKARAGRVAWPNVCPNCNTGTHGRCDCPPQAGSAVSGIEGEDGYEPIGYSAAAKAERAVHVVIGMVFAGIVCAHFWAKYGSPF